jgi:hypothetical protein
MPCRVQSEVELAIWSSETCPVQAHRWTPKSVFDHWRYAITGADAI